MNVRYVLFTVALIFLIATGTVFFLSHTRNAEPVPQTIQSGGRNDISPIANTVHGGRPIQISEPYITNEDPSQPSQVNTNPKQNGNSTLEQRTTIFSPAPREATSPYALYANQSGSIVAALPLQTQLLVTALTSFATSSPNPSAKESELLRTHAHIYLDAARSLEGISSVPSIFSDAHVQLYTSYRHLGSTLTTIASKKDAANIPAFNDAMLANARAVTAIGNILKKENVQLQPTDSGYIYVLIAG